MKQGVKTALAAAAAVLAIAAFGACQSQTAKAAAAKTGAAYIPGVYTATSQGFGGPVSVTVTVSADAVAKVEAAGAGETKGVGSKAIEQLPERIKKAGSADVDGVAGATYSSKAVKEAAGKALAQASGGAAAASGAMKAGTYTASAKGFKSVVSVEVTVDAASIKSVKVLKSDESKGIGAVAVGLLPQAIAAAQTVGVDGVAGASVTSAAVKAAVADALVQAGADMGTFGRKVPAVVEKAKKSLEADVLVVGSGIAGHAAAIGALDSGAKVIVLEKLGMVGGSTNASGSAMMCADNPTETQEVIDFLYERGEKKVSLEQLTFVGKQAKAIFEWVKSMGVEFELGPGGNAPKKWSHRAPDRTGATVIQAMNKDAAKKGADFMLNTRATKLITDASGKVTGVVAESRDTIYTISAKGGVILCTGGFEKNDALMKEYCPNSLDALRLGAYAGDDGDAIVMGKTVGAAFAFPMWGLTGWPEIKLDGTTSMTIKLDAVHIDLNQKLDRYRNESLGGCEKQKMDMIEDGSSRFWGLFDSTAPKSYLDQLDAAVKAGVAFKGNTIEALAKNAGVDAGLLAKTWNEWNAMAAAGSDARFGNKKIAPLTKAPFYLGVDNEYITGTFGGLKINLDAAVLRPDGSAISGLFAAGECANGEYFYRDYICGGSSLVMGATFGKTAGKIAGAQAAKVAMAR